MLLSEYAEISSATKSKQHFIKLGYEFPEKCTQAQKIKVKVSDLLPKSRAMVDISCDCCGKIQNVKYGYYTTYNHDGKTYCNNCSSTMLISGDKHYKWNSELTDAERKERRKCEEYIQFVQSVLERDDYTCQICGKHNNHMDVHHLDGYSWCIEKRYDVKNGITLCKDCHKAFHSFYSWKNNTKEQFEEWAKRPFDLDTHEYVKKIPRKVYCLEDGIIYDSVQDVQKIVNTKHLSRVRMHLNNNTDTHTGRYLVKHLDGKHYIWYDQYINMSEDDIEKYLKEHELIFDFSKTKFKGGN